VYAHADYVTVNISSPNTQGLRDLQQRDALEDLLAALAGTRETCAKENARRVPLFLKVAPDLSAAEREDIAALVLAHGIDALIVSNTTLARPDTLRSTHAGQRGGLSGKPLMGMSTQGLAEFYRLTGGKIPLIGVGGIASAEDAYAKIRAGATLVQLYTALVYQGFGLVRSICDTLPALLARDGFSNIREAVGANVRA
ncbi:MAG: dihydroorotate dehydrogenase (quinone), partial [Proteobacteria bacterium]|nr:dihydroorotate dehydrogenase (quinone) [Pseudomonadota bacterium]